MRFVFRMFGLLFLAAAVVAAVIDGARMIADGRFALTPLGQTWFQINAPSLNITQAAIERHMNPLLWDPVLLNLLLLPTALVTGVLAVLFLVLGRPKRDILA
jgi:hypothetical protein